jgi:hypothetical protein
MDLRPGLQPVRNGGRVSGYMVKPGASLARLRTGRAAAGRRHRSRNGSELDEERLLELSWQIRIRSGWSST